MGRKWLIAGGLGIALLAVCAASILAALPVIREGLAGRISWSALAANTTMADATEEQRATASGPADLRIRTPFGKVEVTAKEDTKEIVIEAHKYAWAATSAQAQSLLQKTKVVVAQNLNSVNVYVQTPVQVDLLHIGPASVSVDFTVTVPIDCSVDAGSASGDVSITGIAGTAVAHSDFGKVAVGQIKGSVEASSNSGDVAVHSAVGGAGDVEATTLFGKAEVTQSSGGKLTVKSSSGDVSASGCAFTGAARLSTEFGQVDAEDLQAALIDARSQSGRVSLTGLQSAAALTAHSGFGDVTVKGSTAASYDLSSSSGRIEADDVQGPVKAHSDYGDVVVMGKNAVLDLSSNSGSVTFAGSLGAGRSVLHTNFGDVHITLPADAQFNADLFTNFGSIHSDFPILATTAESAHLVGAVGSGGPTIRASTDSGSVFLSAQPAE